MAASLFATLTPAIVRTLLTLWTQDSALAQTVATGTLSWFTEWMGDVRQARRAARMLEELADEIVASLEPVFAHAQLADHDKEAALLAVVDSLRALGPHTDALVAAHLDPDVLAKQAAATNPRLDADFGTTGSGAPGRAFHDRMLLEVCRRLVEIADRLPAFQPQVFAHLLAQGDAIERIVHEALERVKHIEAALAGRDPESADAVFERRYRETVARRYDQVEFFGASVESRRYPLTVAFVHLDVVRGGPGSSPMDAHLRAENALSGLDHTTVIGSAGSGKTTLLQWFAVRLADQGLPEALAAWEGRLPFFVRLRGFRDVLPTPADLVAATAPMLDGAAPTGWADRILAEGRGVLLLDGLDELPAERRPKLAKWITEFHSTYPDTRVFLSSRPLAKAFSLPLPRHRTLELHPMRSEQIRRFVRRWHAAVAELLTDEEARTRLHELEAALLETVRSQPAIRRLAESPLLCALLCALNRALESHLPRSRVELYTYACQMLLERRDREREVVAPRWMALSYPQKREMLARLAWWMMRNDLVEIDTDEAEESFQDSLRALGLERDGWGAGELRELMLERSGLLRQPASGRVDFVHKSFLEHLGARGALDARDLGVVRRRAYQEGWRELTVHLVGMSPLQERIRIIEDLLSKGARYQANRHVRVLLAAACVEEATGLPDALQRRAQEQVERLGWPRVLDTGDRHEFAPWVGAGELAVPHLQRGAERSEAEAIGAIRALRAIGSEAALEALAAFKHRSEALVRQHLYNGWSAFSDHEDYFYERILAGMELEDIRVDLDDRALERFPLASWMVFRVNTAHDTSPLAHLPKFPHLRHLRLTGLRRDSLPPHLPNLLHLSTFHLSSYAWCPRLESLNTWVRGQDLLTPIAELEHLVVLYLNVFGSEILDLEPLLKCPALTRVRISGHLSRGRATTIRAPKAIQRILTVE